MHLSSSHPRGLAVARRLCFLLLWALGFGLHHPLVAQTMGTISGRVFNQGTKAYLSGAQVRVADGVPVFTDETGYFEIAAPAGAAKLTASYAGLDAATLEVVVTAGQRATRDVGLTSAEYGKSEVVTLNAFVVATEKEGRAAALTQQRRADNIVNVISADEFPNVAGGSIGEFLRNVPGVVIDYSNADPRSIRVRGFDPNLNSVTVDGMRAANAASGNTNRQFEIDQISLQNVESIEVTKSNRPDQDADSGGGSVNMVSKSAFKLSGRRISYTAMINGNSQDWSPLHKTPGPNEGKNESYKWYPGYSLTYMNSFLHNTVGVVATANDYTFYSAQPNFGMNWTATPAAFGLDARDPRGAYPATVFANVGANYTRRKSLSLNLDYRLGVNTTLYLNSQINTSYIRAWGRGITFNLPAPSTTATSTSVNVLAPGFNDRSVTSVGDINGTTVTSLNSASGSFAQMSSGDLLNKKGVGTTFSGGIKHTVGAWKLDASGGISQSTNHYHLGAPGEEGETFGRADFYLRGISFRADMPPGTHMTGITQLAGPSYLDLGNYVSSSRVTNLTTNTVMGSFTTASTREVNATDRFYTGKVNARRDFAQMRWPFWVQSGLSWREQRRNIDVNTRRRWFYVGPDGVAGTADDTANLGQFIDTNFYRRPYGYQYPLPSLTKITDFYRANPKAFQEDAYFRIQTLGQNLRAITEKVSAAYVEGNVRIGRFSMLAGLRGEDTSDFGSGPVTDNKAAAGITDRVQQAVAIFTSRRASAKSGYHNWFPAVHAKYDVTTDLLVRASFTQSIGRQNFGNIIPGVTVSNATLPVVQVNNPALLPQLYSNYDVSIEYYLKPVGVLSVGGFRKNIRNYTRSFDETIVAGVDYGAGINTDDYVGGTLRRNLNVGDAYVRGIELNYSQHLANYAAWLRGVSIFANLTKLESQGNYGALTQSVLPLDNFIPRTFNTGVTYTRGAFTGSAKFNYKSPYPTSASAGSYNYERGTIDLAASWQFRRELVFFAEVKNVTNEPRDSYRVLTSRVTAYATDGAIFNFGLKGTF
jgi:iron complex outermembrane receptor protein